MARGRARLTPYSIQQKYAQTIDADLPRLRSIRGIKLSRKNALFAGSDGGAEHWAVVASLIETCKLNGVEPYAYLKDVLERMVDGYPDQSTRRAAAVGLARRGSRQALINVSPPDAYVGA